MRPSLGGLLLAALALTACTQAVRVDGRSMSPSSAESTAAADLAKLRSELAGAPPDRQAAALEAHAARYGEVPSSAEALYEAGLRWRAARRPERARAAFENVLTRHPLSERTQQAKLQLALAEAEEGRPRDALTAIAALYDKLPQGDRLEAARGAARSALAAQLVVQALRWRSEAATLLSGAERDRELARAVADLDGLTSLELEKLREELPATSPLLPALDRRLPRPPPQAKQVDSAEARALAERLAQQGPVNPRVLGLAVPLSGKLKGWGEAIVKGAKLALGESGPWRIAARDTRGEPDGAAQALEELVLKDGAVAALGGLANAEAARAGETAQRLGLPFVSLSKLEDVTQAGPFVFRTMLTAEAQAGALVDLAMGQRSMRRFAVLYPAIPYGQELANAFWDAVERRGGEMRGAETYAHDRTTFAPLIKSLVGKLVLEERPDYMGEMGEIARAERDPYRRRKALEKLRERLPPITDFDALFIPDFASKVALIAPALAVEDVVTTTCDTRELLRLRRMTGRGDLQAVQLLGANGWDDPVLVDKAARYVECSIFVDGFFAASERPATRSFVQAFREKHGHPPSILEASAHDAARMIRQVVERGAATRDGVRAGLAEMKGFQGATGDLSFDARRELSRRLFYLTVENGAVRELGPQELGAGGAGGG